MVGGPSWREPASDEDDDDSNVEDRRLQAKKQKKPKPDPKPAPEPAPKRGAWSRLEPRRSARVNAAGQSTDTPERRKPPRRRVPTPPQSTSRQAKRTTRVRPLVASLVAEILVSPDLLPHMLEHLSMRQLHRVAAVCRAFRAAVPHALLLRRAVCPKPLRGAHLIPNPKPALAEPEADHVRAPIPAVAVLAGFRCPTHVVALPDGGVVVADSDNNRVKVFSEQGVLRQTIEFHEGERIFRNPRGLASDGEYLFVSDSSHHCIRKMRLEGGEPIASLGSQGSSRGARAYRAPTPPDCPPHVRVHLPTLLLPPTPPPTPTTPADRTPLHEGRRVQPP